MKQAEVEKLMNLNAEQAGKIIELSCARYQHLKGFVEWLELRVSFVDKDLVHLYGHRLLMEYMDHVK